MAKQIFHDFVGLKKGLQEITVDALNATILDCYKKLMEIINEDVYKKARHDCENHFYERTYDIARSFVIKYAEIKGLGISAKATIDFDENKISHNTALKQHANSQEELDGATFFGILNGDVPQGTEHGFAYVEREPFFNDWLEWMDKNYNSIYGHNLYVEKRKRGIKPQSATAKN